MMELLLSPTECDLVTRHASPTEMAYIIAIKQLTNATEISIAQLLSIFSLIHNITNALHQTDAPIMWLSDDYYNAPSRLEAIISGLRKPANAAQNVGDLRHDLLLGLPGASQDWFRQKADLMQLTTCMYMQQEVEQNSILRELQKIEPAIHLAISHTAMLESHVMKSNEAYLGRC